jgi:hypothetical protein
MSNVNAGVNLWLLELTPVYIIISFSKTKFVLTFASL